MFTLPPGPMTWPSFEFHDFISSPPEAAAVQPGNKNRRRNTSLLIRYAHPDGRRRHIVIDAGKFFYHSALQWFPYFGVRELDAVIITHSHADAIGGLDDLRDWTNNIQESIDVYTSQRDFEVMKKTHYYIVDSSSIVKGTAVSDIEFRIISETQPFFVHGLQVTPLPVWHGAGYKSLGFRVGNLCYISDVSEIPADTYRLLENCMMHLMDHDKVNMELRLLLESEGLDVQLSYDGLRIPLPLAVNPPQLALANDLSPRDR
ncbi:hypothetical protein CBR_g36949 [Chara braunii]|uniref:Metallo-beta-lactamase domain-containing protein n=1 Tax=Chara braunii TaxID=69332 RepID=A0A388JZE8_CHABU|nr:hypothetical protein CBR_g36949 [Chara braunii]|eukprot:GBG63180.1 hypothetical protein CBR_g36949 [Chara braunii]